MDTNKINNKTNDFSNFITEDFSIDDIEIVEAPENFEIDIMNKIENIEPDYIKEKNEKSLIMYIIMSISSLMFALFAIIHITYKNDLSNIKNIPIVSYYYSIFDSIPDFSNITFVSLSNFFSNLLYIMIGQLKYIAICGIIFLIITQYLLYKKESLKV